MVPPRKEQIRFVDRHPRAEEPGGPESRLEPQTHRGPFSSAPEASENRHQGKRHLAPEDLRAGHRPFAR
jgi:hypothetical protein